MDNNRQIDPQGVMVRHLEDIQDNVGNCQAGCAFLGDVFKHCGEITLSKTSAKGLGHLLHCLATDVDFTEDDLDQLGNFLKGLEVRNG